MIRVLLVTLLFLAACGQEQQDLPLKATMTSPTDVTLQWRAEPDVAGHVVEYANEEKGEYTILEFVPPGRTTFDHPDLIPETNFYYRVRPYDGPASGTVDVVLPPGDEVSETDGHDWAAPVARPGGSQPVSSPGAAPTDLRYEVKHANGILFTWVDNASDEDGYLLELRPEGSADYRTAAQLDPNVVSSGLITLPDEKRASYRVRPFRFGTATNLVHQKTGKDPQ